MANLNGFNAEEVEPQTGFDALPAGKYEVCIIESEERANKSGNGSHIYLKFQVIDGEFKNRNLFARLNLDNPNQTAVNIAKAELSAICRAVGVLQPKDSVDLHNIPLVAVVKQGEYNGQATNEIARYEKKETAGATPQGGGNPPWIRK